MSFLISHSECLDMVFRKISKKYFDKKMFLDVGCGDGERTLMFNKKERKIFGVDYQDWRKDEYKRKINFKKKDFLVSGLPFRDEYFDIIFCFDVIEHLPKPKKMLGEIFRVLKINGILIIGTPNKNRIFGFFLQILGLRRFPYYPNQKTRDIDRYSAHIKEYTYHELKNLLDKERFTIISSHRLFYGITSRFGFCRLNRLPFYHNIILECRKEK